MSAPVLLLVVVAMALGLAGTLLPALPGLPLIWGAALAGHVSAGFDGLAWTTMGVLTLLMAGGIAAKYVLPAQRAGQTAPRRSLLWGALGAGVGFFVVPVIGFVIGGVAGIYLAEVQRTGDGVAARTTTVVALRRFGLGVLLEIAAGLAMILVFLIGIVLG